MRDASEQGVDIVYADWVEDGSGGLGSCERDAVHTDCQGIEDRFEPGRDENDS